MKLIAKDNDTYRDNYCYRTHRIIRVGPHGSQFLDTQFLDCWWVTSGLRTQWTSDLYHAARLTDHEATLIMHGLQSNPPLEFENDAPIKYDYINVGIMSTLETGE